METFIQSNTSVLIVLTTGKKNKENRTKRPDKLDKNTSTKFLIESHKFMQLAALQQKHWRNRERYKRSNSHIT